MIDKNKNVIFIDLDSTLIKTTTGYPFPKNILDFEPMWETWNALKDWANGKSYCYIFIISNQGGIETRSSSKERYIVSKLNYISCALQEYIERNCKNCTVIVDFEYCPSNKKDNPDRKPNVGMIYKLLNKYSCNSISKNEMIMIGDASGKPGDFSDSDLQCAKNFSIDYIDVESL